MLIPVSRAARLFPSSSYSFSLISLSPSDIEMVSLTSWNPPASTSTLNEYDITALSKSPAPVSMLPGTSMISFPLISSSELFVIPALKGIILPDFAVFLKPYEKSSLIPLSESVLPPFTNITLLGSSMLPVSSGISDSMLSSSPLAVSFPPHAKKAVIIMTAAIPEIKTVFPEIICLNFIRPALNFLHFYQNVSSASL